MPMIPIDLIHRKRLLTARNSKLPAVVIDGLTFSIPPAVRGEREHKVRLDDLERPAVCSCTCEKGVNGEPCWAMARALAVLQVLGDNHIYVSRGAASGWQALLEAASAVERPASFRLVEGSHPEAETLYVAP